MAALLTNPSLPTHEQLQFSPDESINDQVQHVGPTPMYALREPGLTFRRFAPFQISQGWLTKLEIASQTNDAEAFSALFMDSAIWRDILAFTNDYRSIEKNNIATAAKVCLRPSLLF